MQIISTVYRCKPEAYWNTIRIEHNNLMKKYVKDNNGQPGNLINGKIHGLFFTAQMCRGKPPDSSPFGNMRMDLNCLEILNPEKHNFYFADFYCNREMHYVTIVICVNNSESDNYCRENLIELNPFANNFLIIERSTNDKFSRWKFFVNFAVRVELFYTENLTLDSGNLTEITATGAGTSRANGLPNNKQCTKCNLYALQPSKKGNK